MKYLSGEDLQVGDRVKLWDGNVGVVVCSIDDGVYSSEFSKEDWQYLSEGVLINSEKAGLIHVTESNEDMELIQRSNN
jgi:pyruvate kinase